MPAMNPETARLSCKIDGRTSAGRRRRDLIAGFVAALGGAGAVTAIQQAAVVRVAELMAAAETLRRRALAGETVDMAALIKLENVAARSVRELGITETERDPTPNLRVYLAKREGHREVAV